MNAPSPELREAVLAAACFIAACLGLGLALRLAAEVLVIVALAALGAP